MQPCIKACISPMDELKDILAGLEQRIAVYKTRMAELQKKKEKIEDELRTVRKYLDLAETLYKVEVDKAKPSRESSASEAILFSKLKFSGMSVPQAAYLLLLEAGKPLHAKEIYQRVIDGGGRIRGKTPVTSVAISLARDRRFKRVAPNTFALVPETEQPAGESVERG